MNIINNLHDMIIYFYEQNYSYLGHVHQCTFENSKIIKYITSILTRHRYRYFFVIQWISC